MKIETREELNAAIIEYGRLLLIDGDGKQCVQREAILDAFFLKSDSLRLRKLKALQERFSVLNYQERYETDPFVTEVLVDLANEILAQAIAVEEVTK